MIFIRDYFCLFAMIAFLLFCLDELLFHLHLSREEKIYQQKVQECINSDPIYGYDKSEFIRDESHRYYSSETHGIVSFLMNVFLFISVFGSISYIIYYITLSDKG